MAPSRLIIDSIDFAQASVSGTFSSSSTFTFGTLFSTSIATAWAWFQPKSSRGPTYTAPSTTSSAASARPIIPIGKVAAANPAAPALSSLRLLITAFGMFQLLFE